MSEDLPGQPAGSAGEREPRIKLSELASIELPEGRTIGVRISDVSASGFRMETPEPLEVGLRVMLVMRRYEPVPAEIRWSVGVEAGATFLAAGDTSIM